MALSMLHYYFLKRIVDNTPTPIKEKLEYDNDLIFNLSTFNDLGMFYKLFHPVKKDKYKLNEKLSSEQFKDFILECLFICKKNNDNQQLLFIYAMICHNILKENIDTFLSARLTKKLKYDIACNMIDFYYAKAYDKLDLTKIPLTAFFPNGFTYYEFMEELIHNPFIKIFSFFCTKQYFSHAMKRKKFYYSYCNRSRTKIKLIFYKFYDWIFNHRGKPKASHYLYTKKVNTTLFNLRNKPYLIGEETYTYSLENVIDNAYNLAKDNLEVINQYIFYDNDKPLKKFYKIEKTENI